MNLVKNKTIADTRKATKLRRKTLSCKVYSCKVDESHLSKKSAEFLRMIFIEAKWFVNDILARDAIFSSDYKKKNPTVLKDGKIPEERQLAYLPSQVRQKLAEQLKQDVYTLAKMKAKGIKVGKIGFKKEVRCLPLNQNGVTFRIIDKHRIRLQGNRAAIRVNGLGQISKDAEVAQACLVHRAGNYFIKFTCFLPKVSRIKTGKAVGLDFGIETTVKTSDGEPFNVCIPEPTRLRRLQRGKFSRKVKGSKNWVKTNKKIAVEYDKVVNQKRDLQNKLVSKLTKEYDIIVCQDEAIKEWKKGWFGRQVQRSCMGEIISDLKHKSETFVRVDRFFPSTQTCDVCGERQKVELSERVFVCQSCGNAKDRDTHSAINILNEGLKTLRAMGSPGHVKTPVEPLTSGDIALWGVSKSVVLKQEATAFQGVVAHLVIVTEERELNA
jgi:transposase